jgi:hypothetical protein
MIAHDRTGSSPSAPTWTQLGRCLVVLLLLCACDWIEAKPHTIGFAQSDTSESDWRRANTESFRVAA